MADFIQLTLAGLALGSIYALVALGFVIIYRASQVFNFAQVEFLTLGAFLMVALSRLGLPWILALLGAMLLTGMVAGPGSPPIHLLWRPGFQARGRETGGHRDRQEQ